MGTPRCHSRVAPLLSPVPGPDTSHCLSLCHHVWFSPASPFSWWQTQWWTHQPSGKERRQGQLDGGYPRTQMPMVDKHPEIRKVRADSLSSLSSQVWQGPPQRIVCSLFPVSPTGISFSVKFAKFEVCIFVKQWLLSMISFICLCIYWCCGLNSVSCTC
jgi:hypothetical protein